MTYSLLFSDEAEQGVIGGLLLDPRAVDRLGDEIKPAHFYRDDHRRIFAAIQRLNLANKPFDVAAVYAELEESGEAQQCGGIAYMAEIADNTASYANIRRYGEIVIERATLRMLRAIGDEIATAAIEPGKSAAEKVDSAQAKVMSLTDRVSRKFEPVMVEDAMRRHLSRIDDRREGRIPTGLSTGFPDLDKRMNGGLHPGQLIILAARPGVGKSAFAMQVALHFALAARPSLFCSQEMPESDLMDRITSLHTRIPLGRVIRANEMTSDDYDRLTALAPQLLNTPLMLDEQPSLTLMAVRNKVRKAARQLGRLGLLVVDYLQLMVSEESGQSRNAEIEQISRGLKQLAKEFGMPVIALSQLSRKCEERPNRRPLASDLRDSGAIEQDADAILTLYRDEIYNPDSAYKGLAELGIIKNRQGPTGGFVGLAYQGEYTRFDSLFGDWPQPQAQKQGKKRGGFDD